MRLVRLIPVLAIGALLIGASGCGGSCGYVKVSGVVTLDGNPYQNAIVSFQPLGSPGNPNPGRGSTGLTDKNGRYTLTTDDGYTGAVVGKHRIRIRTRVDDPAAVIDPTVGSPDNPPPRGKVVEPIPQEWFADHTTKEYEVPAGGTDKADFAIVTKKK